MTTPRFSIVIPTKDRPHTLQFSLQTCLNQQYDNYEIVVCDNCSSSDIKSVVDSFSNPKIRYLRSDIPLSMTDNWNLAYSALQGEYVIYIGDDDGLMPDSLQILASLLIQYQPSAIVWDWAVYTWPDFICSEAANYLRVSLRSSLEWLQSHRTIRQVLQGESAPNRLPNVYHGLIKRDILEQIRSRTGNVFHGWYPDTFTSFSVASLISKHLSVSMPISVIALSGASNGAALIYSRNKHPAANSYRIAARGAGQTLHPWVADIPSLWSVLADSFLQSKARLFPEDNSIVFDRQQFVTRWMLEMPADSDSEQRSSIMPTRLGYDGESLHMILGELGIRNVVDAVQLTFNICGRNKSKVVFAEPAPSTSPRLCPEKSTDNTVIPRQKSFLIWQRIKEAIRLRLSRIHQVLY